MTAACVVDDTSKSWQTPLKAPRSSKMKECMSKNEQRVSREAMRGALDSTKSIHPETTKNHNIPYIKRRRLHTVVSSF